jgi:hypothetical protein
MKKISVLRAILRNRGYLVLPCGPNAPQWPIGHVTAQCGGEGFNIGLLAIRSRTTLADFREQCRLSKQLEPAHWKHGSPTAYVEKARKIGATFWKATRTKREAACAAHGISF